MSDTGALLLSYAEHCLAVVPATGGEPKPLDIPSKFNEDGCREAEFLSGGDDFIFHSGSPVKMDDMAIYLSSVRGQKASDPVLLLKNRSAAHYTPAGGGRILYLRDDNLYSQKLDRRARRVESEPELIVQGVASAPSVSYFSVAGNGTIAWRPGKPALLQIVEFDRSGKQISTSGPPGIYRLIALSPDGNRLLADSPEGGSLIDIGQPGKLGLPCGRLLDRMVGGRLQADRIYRSFAGQSIRRRIG